MLKGWKSINQSIDQSHPILFVFNYWYSDGKGRLTRMLYRWGWNCRKLQEKKRNLKTATFARVMNIIAVHSLVWHGTQTYWIDRPSTRNQSQWGSGGRSRQLCSPHVSAGAASAWCAAQSRAGTPTVQKTTVNTELPLHRKEWRCAKIKWTLPEGIVPGRLSVVSWGTILRLYRRPTKHTF